MLKILFICHGNICRSPMAEFVMKDLAAKAGLSRQIYAASAATSTEETGSPVYPSVRRLLAAHGIDSSGKTARQMTRADYSDYDFLIGMDEENMDWMRRLYRNDPDNKLRLLLDFTAHPGSVADPWYTRDFEAAWRDINDGCRGLLSYCQEILSKQARS